MRILLLFLTLTAVLVAKAEPNLIEEDSLNYNVRQDGCRNCIQIYTQFIDASEADLQIPKFADPYKIVSEKEGIQYFVIIRSSFNLNVSPQEVRTRVTNPMELAQFSKKLKVESCAGGLCQGYIAHGFTSNGVKFKSSLADKNTPNWLPFIQSIHNPDFILTLNFTQIESVFLHCSSISAFYKIADNQTFVQNYYLFSVKKSAYEKAQRIPFFNLENKIHNVLKELIIDTRSSILHEKKYSSLTVRGPASNNYDKNLYMQNSYQLVDPVGDDALIARALAVPHNLKNALLHSKQNTENNAKDPWLPEPWEMQDPLAGSQPKSTKKSGPSIQGRDNPLKVAEFVKTLNEVMLEESQRGLHASVGTFHEWAPETLYKYSGRNIVGFSKLFICLTLGFTNRFMKTGTEHDLWDWIIQQPYNSIMLPELFRASYRMNQGDVYLSLLTIENILSSNWRYNGRENLPVTKRLRPITSGYNYDNDKYGTWYHFFGIILYGYETSAFRAHVVGSVEALGSNILSRGDKTQKQWFNVKGGAVGSALRASIEKKNYLQDNANPAVLKEDFYLNRSEDFRDRLPLVSTGNLKLEISEFPVEEIGITLEVQNLGPDLYFCRMTVMLNRGRGYTSDPNFTYSYQISQMKSQEKIQVSLFEKSFKGIRVFIDQCQQPQAESRAAELFVR